MIKKYFIGLLSICILSTCILDSVTAAPKKRRKATREDSLLKSAGPFSGNWKGKWVKTDKLYKNEPDIAAQVIALDKDMYQIILKANLIMRCPAFIVVEAKANGNILKFEKDGFYGEIKGDKFTGGRVGGKHLFELKKFKFNSATLGAKAPKGAIVLLDGTDLNEWEKKDEWEILPDKSMIRTQKGKDFISKRKFKDCKIHLEFKLPFLPWARGQGRGNSGVFIEGYEVQVLDSFGLEGLYNECGALYKVAAPKVNACAPPLEWQTYDIDFTAAKADKNGKVIANPRITVIHNGILIHNDQEIFQNTAHFYKDRISPLTYAPGPLKLQAHGNFIVYRNIWVVNK